MTRSASQLVHLGGAVIEQLGTNAVNFAELDPKAPAAAENTLANRSGIDPETDFVSIPGAWHYLTLKLHAARQHLACCLQLMGLSPERQVVGPAHTLARSAIEACAVSLWLCSNAIGWEERLQRFSQLHLASVYSCLMAMGFDPRKPPDPSTVDQDVIVSIDECNTLLCWVADRGWTCTKGKKQGKPPTIGTWVAEVPTYSDLMDEASKIVAIPSGELRRLYATYSRSAHTNPVSVIAGPLEGEAARLASARDAVAIGVALYGIAWGLFAGWCSFSLPEDAAANIVALLR